MPTRINLAPNGPQGRAPEGRAPGVRRFNLNRSLAFGAALALWAAILVGFKLLTI